ncbi:amino acid adenylation domain-containing protein [Kosakonia cowanii]|uniref:amino acid adenylation domain-containing protein n=1 Tax=Kosakonia cowanii TaxID=208223 RepID=UPI00406439CB
MSALIDKDYVALTSAQMGMWLANEVTLHPGNNTISEYLIIDGEVIPRFFKAAVRQMIAEAETMHGRFYQTDNTVKQQLPAIENYDAAFYDFSARPEPLEAALAFMNEQTNQHFSLMQGNAFTFFLIKLSAKRYIYYHCCHHILLDGFGASLILRRTVDIYDALVMDKPVPPTPFGNFRALLAEEAAYRNSNRFIRDRDYWMARFQDTPTAASLAGRSAPDAPIIRQRKNIDAGLHRALHRHAEAAGCTLPQLLTALTAIYLYRMTGHEEVVIGLPLAARVGRVQRTTPAMMSNILPLRLPLSPALTLDDVLALTAKEMMSALRHQQYPHDDLTRDLSLTRPLYHTTVNVELFGDDLAFDGAKTFPVNTSNGPVEDLAIFFYGYGDAHTLVVGFDANSALYSPESLSAHHHRMLALFSKLIDHPHAPIAAPSLLSAEEERLLAQANDTCAPVPPLSFAALFERQARSTPHAPALDDWHTQLSYSELNCQANRLSRYIQAQGVRPGDSVALLLPRTVDMVIAMLAVAKAQAVYLPLDAGHPAERLQHILATAQPALILSSAQTAGIITGYRQQQIDSDAAVAAIAAQNDDNLATLPQPQQPAYVLFTSGSTGAPKGVLVSHGALTNFLTAMQHTVQLTAQHRLLAVTTLSFDIAALELLLPLMSGASVVIASRECARDPRLLAQAIAEKQISHMQGTPALWHGLVAYQPDSLAGLTALVGGDALPNMLAQQMVARAARVIQLYGPTETTIWSTISELSAANLSPSVIGKPLFNTRIHILDDALKPVPVGQPGELYIAGDGLAIGYLNRADLTCERFVASPFDEGGQRMYRTGDMACWSEEQTIIFLGRVDNQVKIRGYRIELGEIENVLHALPEVKQALVVAHEEPASGQKRLVAYVVAHNADACTPEALRAASAQKLPDYMVPALVMLLAHLPLTANGKIDRRALPKPTFTSLARVPPTTAQQQELCRLFAECLAIEPPGIHDNFFSLGGHSLLALQLLNRLRQSFGVELSLKTLFDAPTVAELSTHIAQTHSQPARPALTAQPRPAQLPMSFAQQRLWLQQQIAPSSAYNMPLALTLSGPLDAAVLAQALSDVIARHESLRTLLTQQEEMPCQQILPAHDVKFTLPTLTIAPEHLDEQLEKHCQHLFALDSELPVKAWLYQLAADQHVLLLLIHHTAGDGGSLLPLLEDLSLCWQARATGQRPSLPPLAVQYADYALWQRALLSEAPGANARYTQQMAYWCQQLAGVPEEVTLPADRPRPAQADYRGDHVDFALTHELLSRLKQRSDELGVSLFMLLHTAVATLLHRLGAGDDIVIGTPIFARSDVALLPLIGYFANTAVLRTDMRGNPTLNAILAQAKSAVLEANQHQDLPFEQVVEALAPDRTLARHPLFQVMIVVDTPWPQAVTFPQVGVAQRQLPTTTAKFDVLFHFDVDEAQQRLSGHIEYATALYDSATIAGFTQQLIRVIETIVQRPDARVAEVSLLSDTQRETVLKRWNATDVTLPPLTLAGLFETQVQRAPDAIAVKEGDKTLSYRHLNAAANQLAHRLMEQTRGAPFCAGLLMQHSINEVIAVLAVIKAGGAYLPLRITDPLERQQFIVDEAGATLLLADAALPRPTVDNVILLDDLPKSHWPVSNPPQPSVPGTLAYIMFTSGSTGKPKGIAVEQQSVAALALDRRWRAEDHQRVLLHSPSAFDASTWELWVPLLCGGTVIVAPAGELDIDTLTQTIVEEKITALWLTAGLFHLMAEVHPQAMKAVHLLIAGGDVLSTHAIREVMRHNPTLVMMNGYGPTETTTFATTWRMAQIPDGVTVPVGTPLDNMQVYVLDAYLNPVPVGMPGELYIAGIGLARGYHRNPCLTATHFVANPFSAPGARMYRSGDWVRWRQDGVLEYLNRGDQQVKIRGFRIELAEVEAALQKQATVAQALVSARESSPGNRQLIAWVTAKPGETCDADALRRALGAQLPDFMVPAMIIALEHLPLTANGKVDQRALPAPHFATTAHRAPRNDLERTLCALFAAVLGVPEVGIDDHFFALGGHSLMASRLVSRIRRVLNLNPAIRDLFEAPTVAQFAGRLQASGSARPRLCPHQRPPRLPLSSAQRRLWMVDRIEQGKFTYNMPVTLTLRGEVVVSALMMALDDIVLRHESLRTRFHELNDGTVCQKITPPSSACCLLTQLTVSADDLPHAVQTAAQYTFDLAQEDPCRAWLFKVDEGQHLLLILMHHIASDGGSIAPLLRDLAEAYNARARNQSPAWAELAVQYADYTLWQQALLGAPEEKASLFNRQLAWWRDTLHDLPDELQLPTDRPRPLRASYVGKQCHFAIDARTTTALEALARQHNASLFMVLQAALAVLLCRCGAGEDIPLGTVSEGRSDEALEPLVGFFINTLVMRTDLSGNPTFVTLLDRVREQTLAAWEHQDLPFESLVEALNPARSLARHPLFQVMLVLQNVARSDALFDELETAVATPSLPVAKFDLTFNLEETPEGLRGMVEYAVDLFDEATVVRMAGYFTHLLAAIAANAARRVSELPIFSDAEHHQIMQVWNNSARDVPAATFAEQFEAIVRATPQATALIADEETLTYAQLDRRANRLANLMLARGIGAEQIVAIALPRSVALIVTLIATMKTGAAYLPLDPDYPPDRVEYMLSHAQPGLVVSQAEFADRLAPAYAALHLDHPALRGLLAEQSAEEITLPRRLQCDNAAYLIYTSGSTGTPKGVVVTHRGIGHLVASMVARLHVTPQSRVLQFASLSFDASFWDISMALLSGAALVVATKEALTPGKPLYTLMRERAVTHATLPPVGLAVMPREPLPELATLIVAGEACPPELIAFWGSGRRMINAYGPSESTVCATISQPLQADRLPPIGRPIFNMQAYVLDAHLNPVPPGVKGELYIAGESLARGYLKRPDLTAERFVANLFGARGSRMYRTGDMASWNSDGELMFAGRVDHQVKIRGFRIELGEVESQLRKHPQVAQATVIVREDKPGLRQLVAYAVARDERAQGGEIRDFLRDFLPDYMLPVAVVLLAAIPVTPNGKVDRRALPAPQFARAQHTPPCNAQEQLLSTLFAELLNLPEVDRTMSFFELGGDSITAIQLVARARQAGWLFTPRDVFEHKSVAGLASIMTAVAERESAPQIAAVGELPATPIVHWLMENPGDINAFCQATLLQTPANLDAQALQEMLAALVSHHDALRLTARRDASGDIVLCVPPAADENGMLEIIDDQYLSADQRQQQIQEACRRAKQRLDPARGKMVQAVWFRAAFGQPGQLMLLLHHLVVDGVSWRILAADLLALWRARSAGRKAQLTDAGTSFRTWAMRLEQEAQRRGDELAHWQSVLSQPDALLTTRPLAGARDTLATSASLRMELGSEFTQPLLATLPARFHASINDVLLCALALAITAWREDGQTDVLLDVEGHGREELAGTELSSTVGWFTTLYPVRLAPGRAQLTRPDSLDSALKRVKEQLRQVPDNGLGYGLLRYLNRQTRPLLAALPQPQIGFNYLGRFSVEEARDWQLAAEAHLLDTRAHDSFALPHALSLNAMVEERASGPVLVANWCRATELYAEERVSRLATGWFNWLKALSQLTQVEDIGGFTPSDMPLVALQQAGLLKLQSKWTKKK